MIKAVQEAPIKAADGCWGCFCSIVNRLRSKSIRQWRFSFWHWSKMITWNVKACFLSGLAFPGWYQDRRRSFREELFRGYVVFAGEDSRTIQQQFWIVHSQIFLQDGYNIFHTQFLPIFLSPGIDWTGLSDFILRSTKWRFLPITGCFLLRVAR